MVSPLLNGTQFDNRFHITAGNAGNARTQFDRSSAYKKFVTPFNVFDSIPPKPSIIQWDGDAPEHIGPIDFVKGLLTPNRMLMNKHLELAKFYFELALNSVNGFTADKPSLDDLTVADYLFMRARNHHFKFEDLWWWSEMKKRGGSEKNGVVDSLYFDRSRFHSVLSSMYQIPSKEFLEASARQGNSFFAHVADAAGRDYAEMTRRDAEMQVTILPAHEVSYSSITA